MKIKYKLNISIFVVLASVFVISCSSGEKSLNNDYRTLIKQTERDLWQIDTNNIEEYAKNYVIRGSNLQQMGRYAESIFEFQDALKYDSSANILAPIARSFLQLGRYEQAMKYCLDALKKDSLNLQAMEIMYQVFSYRLRLDSAIIIYKQIVELEPTYFRKLTLARLYELQDKDKAIKQYELMLEDGDNEDLLLRLSELYRSKNDYAKYLETILKISKTKSYNLQMLKNLNEALFLNNQYKESFDVVPLADSNLNSDDLTDFYLKYGNLLLVDTNKESKEYIPAFIKRFDQRFFSRWTIYYLAGYLANKIKDSLQTDIFFNKTLNLIDTIQEIPIDIGEIYFNNKRYDRALSVFNKFEKIFPENYLYPFFIGSIYCAMNRNDKAIEPLTRALDIDDKNYLVLGQLGLVYNNLKDYVKSDSLYEMALDLKPEDALINNNYAYSLSERGVQLDKALEMIKIAVSFDSLNSSYLDTYGWIAYRMGNIESAIEYINKSIATGDASPEVYEHLGDIFSSMGKKEEAVKAYENCLDKDPGNHSVKNKLENIK